MTMTYDEARERYRAAERERLYALRLAAPAAHKRGPDTTPSKPWRDQLANLMGATAVSGLDPRDELDRRTEQLRSQNPGMTYKAAMDHVLAHDPELRHACGSFRQYGSSRG